MKNITIIDKVVSIRSTVKPETITALKELADELVK